MKINKIKLYPIYILLLAYGFYASADTSQEDTSNSVNRFLSFNVNADFELNESLGYFRESIGYGQNILSNNSYFGFFEISLRANALLNSLGIGDKYLRWDFKDISLEFKYGWEFMRNNIFSFGIDTAHGFGLMILQSGGCAPVSYAAAAFSNALGVFGRIKLSNSTSLSLRIGMQHLNAFDRIRSIITSKNFGPYVHLGLMYYLR